MKFTYNWLKDFVELKASPSQLAERLTMTGIEVVSLEKKEDDFVFEIEVTPNRPDCLSIAGIAREISAIFGTKLKFKNQPPNFKKDYKDVFLNIHIEDKKSSPLYTGILIKNLRVENSPSWLRKRLELVGLRSINNVVDITNYILICWGEPLHAFDLDKLRNLAKTEKLNIFVRKARADEKIVTLDGIPRSFSGKEVLLIASGKNKESSYPIAIAGIMGGKETEVDFSTRAILLESAIFNPILIRRGSRALGLSTESSYRFERGVSFYNQRMATSQALALLREICGGEVFSYKESIFLKPKRRKIILDLKKVNDFLGTDLNKTQIKSILEKLNLKPISVSGSKFKVDVPDFRQDIKEEADLMEEIARIYGYENIPLSIPKILPRLNPERSYDLVNYIKDILVGLGLEEAITYSLVSKDNPFVQQKRAIEILNPLSSQQDSLRTTLIQGLLEATAYNFCQNQPYVNIFEIAKVYQLENLRPLEKLSLGIMVSGTKALLTDQGLIKEKLVFLHLKGILETLAERLNLNFEFMAGEKRIDILLNLKVIGEIFPLEKEILQKWDIKYNEVWYLELDLEEILPLIDLKRKFVPLDIYPGIRRDISLMVKDELSVKEISDFIKKEGKELLSEVSIVDYYRGKQIPPGFKGITLRCVYQSKERTLTEEEVNPIHNCLLERLKKNFTVVIRA
ncbi:MAG: phenylalanine--tRNA ligase subunit beta [Candidatus Omnitrophica bacterium]|nr:phenylalanine--tRNA ligase subunit beta [Candidatus Omnitrophota bacterium]